MVQGTQEGLELKWLKTLKAEKKLPKPFLRLVVNICIRWLAILKCRSMGEYCSSERVKHCVNTYYAL